ncbi:MAG: metallophosphoesterase [Clostridia bacterium]|nr:metallophosphoesterase [Clostridia bacterium]
MLRFENQTLYIPGLVNEYRFLHLTDAHAVLWDETEEPVRAEYAEGRARMFSHQGIPAAEMFARSVAWANDHADSLDGVLLTGDIIDFPSASGRAYLEQTLGTLKLPYVYTLGNHDWNYFNDTNTPHAKVAFRPLFSAVCGGNTYISKTRFGELTVIGLDNSMEFYEDGVAETLAETMRGEENVILIQHIPLCTDTLHADTAAKWRRDINIGAGGCDFNGNWRKILALITADDSPVRAVVAGHLHMQHLDLLEGKVPQFLTALNTLGHGTILTVTGKM